MPARRLAPALSLLLLLAGCEMLGIESPERIAAVKEGEGKAIGSACRHANRALEDCYALNARASKAAIFAGWREMDEYMREHKIEGVAPTVAHSAARPEGKAGERMPAASAGATTKGAAAHES